MQIQPQKLKYWFKNGAYLGLIIFSEEGNKGYLKNTTTVVASNDQQNNPVTKENETTTTTTETKAEHRGILGSTLHAIGWVIALPFRLVGGLIGWIF